MSFEKVANIGDSIKALDFMPCEGRDDKYVVGEVVDKLENGFMILVTEDTLYPKGARTKIYVPFDIGFTDYEGRVTKIG